jgi:hypothetical protein
MTRDKELDDYRGDVWYEEWRRGLPDGALSDDCISAGFDAGVDPSRLVDSEQRRRDLLRAQREVEEYEQQYPPEEETDEDCHLDVEA